MAPQSSLKTEQDNVQNTKVSGEVLNENTVQVNDCIYDTLSLAAIHPGGELFVKAFSGRDATEAFMSYHRREFPHNRVTDSLVGKAVAAKPVSIDADYMELCALVEKVLPKNKAFAPFSYFVKIGVLLTLTLGLEYYIHSTGSYKWYLTGINGWFFALVGLNIQHDANHGSISRNPLVNRVLGLTQNWIGGSALDWIHQHVVQHHISPNDVNHDPDIAGNSFLRFNPLRPRESQHLLQHIYVFVLLCFFGMTYIIDSMVHIVKGFHYSHMSALVKSNRYFEAATILFFGVRWIVMPLYYYPSVYTILNILPLFMVGGYYLAFFFIISHNFDGVHFLEKDAIAVPTAETSFLRRQVVTAGNVCGAKLAWLNGGLNYQIEHHCFPRISHAHYATIAPIVRDFCKKKGIPYVHFDTISENVASCVKHLYTMAREQEPEGYKNVNNVNKKGGDAKKTK